MKASMPENEINRLAALRRYHILDTPREVIFDTITRLAAQICNVPIALVSLVDAKRQWFKSKVRLNATETSRDAAFCAHAILQSGIFIVPDTLADPRFADNPLVISEPHIRFYAGVPLVTPDNYRLGTLCVIDHVPRELNEEQVAALSALSREAMRQLELRRENLEANTLREHAEQALVEQTRELQYSKQALEEQTEILQSILGSMSDGVLVTDRHENILFGNSAADQMIGTSIVGMRSAEQAESLSTHFPMILQAEQSREMLLTRALRGDAFDAAEVLVRHKKEPKNVWLSVSGRPLKDSNGDMRCSILVFHDITEQKHKEQHLTHLAKHDDLTNLPNRSLFHDYLHQALARGLRQQELVAVLFLDLDEFKSINDTLGHHSGDLVLQTIAERLRECVRKSDTVARLSGDEFAIILDSISRKEDASRVAQKIREALSKPLQLEGQEVSVTASIGISIYPTDGKHPQALLTNADTAMYLVKEQGGNGYHHYSPERGG